MEHVSKIHLACCKKLSYLNGKTLNIIKENVLLKPIKKKGVSPKRNKSRSDFLIGVIIRIGKKTIPNHTL